MQQRPWSKWSTIAWSIREAHLRVRRPQLFFRGDLWIALLGPNLEEGIVGIGSTVGAALRAFDAQYLAGQRPPNEKISSSFKTRQSYTVQLRRLPEC